MLVKKRNGKLEELDITQVRKQTIPACEGLRNVSYEEVELGTNVVLYDGITSEEIQKALINSATNLISIESSDYSYVAARLTLYDLYHRIKRLYNKSGSGDVYSKVTLKDYIELNKEFLSDWYTKYTDDEIEELNKEIMSERDLLFNYLGIKICINNYLIKSLGEVSELPQHMHMAIGMFIMQNEDKSKRLDLIKEYYSAVSKLEYINPTPMNANGRVKRGGLISCLLTTINDTTESIMGKFTEIAKGSALGSGWGIDVSRIRSLGAKIGINPNASGGKIPFMKVLNDILLAWNQNGKRPGAGAVYLSIWDIDVFDFLDLKKKHGDERRRAQDIFPALSIDDVFMTRLKEGGNYTLFDPYDCPLLTETYGDEFKEAYENYEKEFQSNPSKFNKNTRTVTTKELMLYIINSYYENGTPFLFFKDTVNKTHRHKQNGIIRSSNLCFTGDTRVALPNDDKDKPMISKTIKELADYSYKKKKFKTFSAKELEKGESEDGSMWKREVKDAVAFKTGRRKVISVVLENSDIFRCTPDHPLALHEGGYIEAKDSVGCKLEGYSDKGYPYLTVMGVYDDGEEEDVYDLTVEDNSNFYIITHHFDDNYECAHGILVHNCSEITLPTTDELTAVCNLGCLNMAKVNKEEDIKRITKIAIRAMDNSIDLTQYPSESSRKFQDLYRSCGLGVTGEAEYIAVNKIEYGSDEHKAYVEMFYKTMSDTAYETTRELAKEKGSCSIEGERNAYLMAIAPNSSSGIFASTTNSHEPVYAKTWMEGTSKDPIRATAPNIQPENASYYKSAFEIPIEKQIEVNAIRQKYIDMSISFNLYFNPEEISTKKVRDAIIKAWESGLKCTYYLRSKAVDNSSLNTKNNKDEFEGIELKTSNNGIYCVGCSN